MTVRVTAAFGRYDHIADLCSGDVVVPDVLVDASSLEIEDLVRQSAVGCPWDVFEMSLARYVQRVGVGEVGVAALPVFPARMFRHSAVYVRTERRVGSVADALEGARIGITDWCQTTGVWVRGMLTHDYSVDLSEVEWIVGYLDEPPPGGLGTTPPNLGALHSLSGMLVAGDLDAVIAPRAPLCFREGHPGVTCLFDDPRRAATEWFRSSGIFPIMHVVVVRQALAAQHPWLAGRLIEALGEAKDRSLRRLVGGNIPSVPLPWMAEHAREVQNLLGADWWPYGLEANRRALSTFLGYASEQGICDVDLRVDDLFAGSTCADVGTAGRSSDNLDSARAPGKATTLESPNVAPCNTRAGVN